MSAFLCNMYSICVFSGLGLIFGQLLSLRNTLGVYGAYGNGYGYGNNVTVIVTATGGTASATGGSGTATGGSNTNTDNDSNVATNGGRSISGKIETILQTFVDRITVLFRI